MDEFRDTTQDWIHDSAYGHLHLRDFFAAFALAGIAAANLDQDYGIDAAMAYNYADSMLAQREKPDGSQKPE